MSEQVTTEQFTIFTPNDVTDFIFDLPLGSWVLDVKVKHGTNIGILWYLQPKNPGPLKSKIKLKFVKKGGIVDPGIHDWIQLPSVSIGSKWQMVWWKS